MFEITVKENDDFLLYTKLKNKASLATVSFSIEVESKKGRFIAAISNKKWYYLHPPITLFTVSSVRKKNQKHFVVLLFT
ncbi:hypothetical protein [Flavivirga sp. 57AJ16]|uniref:hypothetical protein n=1 Tax=Flavivirga sp. 57AJ16 TaxID=3025307 RepID=UPI002366D06D|nr:hypothetical protein [Flavivirga sp. 57AJ16]MDD7886492.1 hypothetical protein [Flavivirga sp. 57AJ16]